MLYDLVPKVELNPTSRRIASTSHTLMAMLKPPEEKQLAGILGQLHR